MEICYIYRYLFVIGALILMTGITGCSEVNSSHHYEAMPFERQTPGNPTTNDYALHFIVDYKVVEQGATYTYRYGGGSETHGLGGGRSGYGAFGELVLDFKFKDGRAFHEVINLRKLMANMLQRYKIHNLSDTHLEYNGGAEVNIKIDKERIFIDYTLDKTKSMNPLISEYYQYPLFEKSLLENNELLPLPGNPDLNLFGIRFYLDRDIFCEGNYKYTAEDGKIIPINELGRYGYQNVGKLYLNFTFTNGQNIRKDIDLKQLFIELQNNLNIIDLSRSKFGGYADLVIRIERDHLTIDYRLLERKKKQKLKAVSWHESYKREEDRPGTGYRLIQTLTAHPSQYTEHLYPIYHYNFNSK